MSSRTEQLSLFKVPSAPGHAKRAAKKVPQGSSSAALQCCTPEAVVVSRFEGLVERHEQGRTPLLECIRRFSHPAELMP